MGFHTVSGDSPEAPRSFRTKDTDMAAQTVNINLYSHRKLTSACTSTEAWLMGINMASGHSTDYGHPNVLRW